MPKGLDTGKAFFQGLLSKITDPGQRAAAEALLANDTVMTDLGSGVAGQSEIDRQLQELRTKTTELETQVHEVADQREHLNTVHEQQVQWWTANKDAVEEWRAMKTATPGNGNPKPGAKPDGTQALTVEAYNSAIADERASFLGFQRDQNHLTREHYTKFGEILDLEPLLRHQQIGQVGLIGVYQILHKDRLEKFDADKKQKDEEIIRADERQKIAQSQATLPYPTPTGVGSGSPLDALTATKPIDSVTDAAVSHYARLQAERAGATR